jgi:hypothetical protein
MRMKWILLISAVLTLLGFVTGCVTSVDGRMTPGVPLMQDKKSSLYERDVLEVWAAAKDVLDYNGKLYSEDHMKSTLEAAINQRTVWVKVEPVDQKLTRVVVQARTNLGAGDVDLAAEIDKQIALRLVSGNLTPVTRGNPPNLPPVGTSK